ncbi:MAG: hypothetical protein JJT96_10805 [Opitutales bacterium]|nr:hypothetical protein [Opitutales bacterium]
MILNVRSGTSGCQSTEGSRPRINSGRNDPRFLGANKCSKPVIVTEITSLPMIEPKWKNLPARPQNLAVPSGCLLADDVFWKHYFENDSPGKDMVTKLELDEAGCLVVQKKANDGYVLEPWPRLGAFRCLSGDPRPAIRSAGWILPRALEAALPTIETFARAEEAAVRGHFERMLEFKEILLPLKLDPASASALRAFNEQIPRDVLDTVFRWRFPERHFALVAACAVPGFRELIDAHPQLAFLLAPEIQESRQQAGFSLREWERFLSVRPHDIAHAQLGLPKRRAALTILRRCRMICLQRVGLLQEVQKAFRHTHLWDAILSLLPPLGKPIIRLLSHRIPPHPQLVRSIHEEFWCDPERKDANMLADFFHFIADEQRYLPPNEQCALSSIRSLRRLVTEYDKVKRFCVRRELVAAANVMPQAGPGLTFPFRIVPGLTKPLLTRSDLLEVGSEKEFSNCLREPDVLKRHIEAALADEARLIVFECGPSKALVEIRRGANGWWLREAKGPRNKPVPKSLMKAILIWCRVEGVRDAPTARRGFPPDMLD